MSWIFLPGSEADRWDLLWSDYNCNWRQLAFDQGREPASWVLGNLALDADANGILFPSIAHPGGTNLVLFNPGALPLQKLRVHDPKGDLPRDAASW